MSRTKHGSKSPGSEYESRRNRMVGAGGGGKGRPPTTKQITSRVERRTAKLKTNSEAMEPR